MQTGTTRAEFLSCADPCRKAGPHLGVCPAWSWGQFGARPAFVPV